MTPFNTYSGHPRARSPSRKVPNATAKLNDIDPRAWLADVLAQLPDHPARRICELLPWNWKTHIVTAVAA